MATIVWRGLVSIIRAITGILFVLSIPILLPTSNMRFAVGEIRLYQYGFDKYNVSARTGIENDELLEIASGLTGYFNSGKELTGIDRFSERELTHLKDVRDLFQFFYRFQEAALGYAVGFAILSYALWRGRWWRTIAKGLVWGSGATIALLLVLGLAVLIDFEQAFLWFHRVGFSNLLWMMRPTDLLPKLFTEGFFLDATLFVVGATVVECLVIGGISGVYLVRIRKRSLAGVATGGGAGAARAGSALRK